MIKIRTDNITTRSFAIPDIRASLSNETKGIIEGHAAVINQRTNINDYFYEVIEPGAFDECDFTDVIFTANHAVNDIPLARSSMNNVDSTLQLAVDEQGLFIRANLDIENNGQSKSLYSAVSRRDIQGMSFIFLVKDNKWTDLDSDMPTRHILKIAKVYETSAVNYPAYSGTDINSRDKNLINQIRNSQQEKRNKELELEKFKINNFY